MARFYGTMRGKGPSCVTRQGTERDGLTARVNGWNIGVTVEAFVNADGRDALRVLATKGSNGDGKKQLLMTLVLDDKNRVVLHPADMPLKLLPGLAVL